MNKELQDLLKNCLESLNNRTEEDIQKMQELYDKEVGRYSNITPSQEFEILYPPTPLIDEELLAICEENDYYTFKLENEENDIQEFYNEKDTWKTINFSDNDYKKVA
ncbi:MAG: hypothetical protein HFE57_07065 [Firmicutes bacterium]|jgi:hypothetical protein|nr:hypothetical protein [Bacillota bacterium]